MKIRPYTPEDFIQVSSIYAQGKLDELVFELKEFTLIPLNQDKKRFSVFQRSQVFVYGEDKVLGYVAIHGSEITSLFVRADERGKAIGAQLLTFALTQRPLPMTLQVVTSNTPAKNLYLKQGFIKQESFLAEYNGVDVWVDKMIYEG